MTDKTHHPTIAIDRDDEPGGTIIPPEFYLPGEDDVCSTEEIAESFGVPPELMALRGSDRRYHEKRRKVFVGNVTRPSLEKFRDE